MCSESSHGCLLQVVLGPPRAARRTRIIVQRYPALAALLARPDRFAHPYCVRKLSAIEKIRRIARLDLLGAVVSGQTGKKLSSGLTRPGNLGTCLTNLRSSAGPAGTTDLGGAFRRGGEPPS